MHVRVVNAHTLEPSSGVRQQNAWIDIVDRMIVDSGIGEPPTPHGGDFRIIDAGGGTVMPGLVDAHVHILVTSTNAAERAQWTPGYATVRALRSAGDMLRRGFTTVRDVGGADHGMARALREGLAPGPRLIFGGKALSQTGGHGDFRSLNDDSQPCCQLKPDFGRIADGVDAVRHAARDEFRKGAHISNSLFPEELRPRPMKSRRCSTHRTKFVRRWSKPRTTTGTSRCMPTILAR